MDKKQAVEKVIRELNPELMELSLGCEVYMLGQYITWANLETDEHGNHTATYLLPDGRFLEGVYTTSEIEAIKIIGHPIHLESVIFTLKKVGYSSTEEWFKVLGKITDIYAHNLPFSQQDDSVFEFLYEILFP